MSALAVPGESSGASPIWLKRKDETDVAFAAFVVYRDQAPPRSAAKVAKVLGKSHDLMKRWSKRFAWVERADAYTDHLDRLAVAAHEEDIVRRRREMNERVFAMAEDMQIAAASRLVGVKDDEGKVLIAPIDPNSFDADDVVRWFESSMKAQRLVLGLPTDVTGQITVSLSDMETILRSFLRLAEDRLAPSDYQALVRDAYALVREQLGG